MQGARTPPCTVHQYAVMHGPAGRWWNMFKNGERQSFLRAAMKHVAPLSDWESRQSSSPELDAPPPPSSGACSCARVMLRRFRIAPFSAVTEPPKRAEDLVTLTGPDQHPPPPRLGSSTPVPSSCSLVVFHNNTPPPPPTHSQTSLFNPIDPQ